MSVPTESTAIGVDAEKIDRLSPRLHDLLFTRRELQALKRLPDAEASNSATVRFCVKEAFFKAQYQLTGRLVDFEAVSIDVEGSRFRLLNESSDSRLEELDWPICGRSMVTGVTAVAGLVVTAASAAVRVSLPHSQAE